MRFFNILYDHPAIPSIASLLYRTHFLYKSRLVRCFFTHLLIPWITAVSLSSICSANVFSFIPVIFSSPIYLFYSIFLPDFYDLWLRLILWELPFAIPPTYWLFIDSELSNGLSLLSISFVPFSSGLLSMIPKELFYQIFLYEFRFNLLGYFRLFYLNLKFVDLIFDLIFSLNFFTELFWFFFII